MIQCGLLIFINCCAQKLILDMTLKIVDDFKSKFVYASDIGYSYPVLTMVIFTSTTATYVIARRVHIE